MAFTHAQSQELSAKLRYKHVKKRRTPHGELSYIEGWHAIAEANRIFGFDSWDRHTLSTNCVWSASRSGKFHCIYTAHVRIIVRAGSITIVRDGTGTGHGEDHSPSLAHDLAIKAAETDATKRALCTFGNPFGLALYDRHQSGVTKPSVKVSKSGPDDKEPISDPQIPTPGKIHQANSHEAAGAPTATAKNGVGIDKSQLALGEPKRIRNKAHLQSITRLPCVVCGRHPTQAHHIQFAQPRALGRKVGDEYTIPLCAIHHRQIHDSGNEREWWETYKIDPLKVADALWRQGLSGQFERKEISTHGQNR
jgi:DNA recombination protein Rad52